jgi:hypothetical protein
MSELDAQRRERLATLLRRGGQAVITTTELAHVPGAEAADVARIAIEDGRAVQHAGDEGLGAAEARERQSAAAPLDEARAA